MNLTSKSRYALKIMLYLSSHNSKGLVNRHDISSSEGIPEKYLDQILLKLRRSSLVESIRGRHGGYKIALASDLISVWDIFRAVEDGIYPVECVDEHEQQCANSQTCSTSEPWRFIFAFLQNSLKEMSLSDLESVLGKKSCCNVSTFRECRPGREPIRL